MDSACGLKRQQELKTVKRYGIKKRIASKFRN